MLPFLYYLYINKAFDKCLRNQPRVSAKPSSINSKIKPMDLQTRSEAIIAPLLSLLPELSNLFDVWPWITCLLRGRDATLREDASRT